MRREAGDFCVFNPRNSHAVPPIRGDSEAPGARIVLATFNGYSPDEEAVFVWS